MTVARALIVENNRHVADFMAMAVRDAGYETEVIRNGRDALQWLSTGHPHLVLLDLRLPRVSGAEILKILVALHEQGKTLIVVTHDKDIAATAERVVELLDGRIARQHYNQERS